MVAVEFALVLPVLLLLIFGIIELGSAWHAKQMLTSASREGARLGIIHSSAGVSDTDVVVQVNSFLGTSGYTKSVSVVVTGVGGATGDPVTVEVSSEWPMPVLGRLVPGLPVVLTIRAATVMRHE